MRTILERRLAARGDTELDEGFTLIELLVVLLILGILIAIAIPTFMSITKSAGKTAAETNLQTALTGADSFYQSNNQTYVGIYGEAAASASDIQQQDTGLSFTTGTAGSTNAHIVGIDDMDSGTILVLTAASTSNNVCYAIVDLKASGTPGSGFSSTAKPAGTYYGAATVAAASDKTDCTPTAMTTGTDTATWSDTGFPAS